MIDPQDTHGGNRSDGSQPDNSQIRPQQDQAEAGGAVPTSTVMYRHISSGS